MSGTGHATFGRRSPPVHLRPMGCARRPEHPARAQDLGGRLRWATPTAIHTGTTTGTTTSTPTGRASAQAALDLSIPDASSRRPTSAGAASCAAPGCSAARVGRRLRARRRRARPPPRPAAVEPPVARRLPLARRRPPHPHAVQLRRACTGSSTRCSTPRVRARLDGDHRPRQRRARQDRRGEGQPRHPRRPRRVRGPDAGLPGPGVEHPGRRARHGVRAPGPQRGRRPQGVRELLRRLGERLERQQPGERAARPGGPGLPRAGGDGAPGRRRAVPRQPPGAPAASTRRTRSAAGATRQPRIALGMEGAPGHQAAGLPKPLGPGSARGLLRQRPVGQQLPRLPAGELRDLRRLRLDDGDRRRPLGQPARRGHAVVDHVELRRPRRLPRRRRPRAEQRLRRQRRATTTRCTAPRGRTPRPATSGPGTTAARTWARPGSPTPRSCRACAPGGSGWTTGGCSTTSTSACATPATAVAPPSGPSSRRSGAAG